MKTFTKRIAFLFLLIWSLSSSVSAARVLIPGGQVIGLELQDASVTVAAFDQNLGNAAKSAGLKAGDRILRINGTEIHCVEDVREALQKCDGQLLISVRRGEQTKQLRLCPPMTEKGRRLGVYLKQGTTGIGTVTYYDPDSGDFAALGHGVNSPSGELLQFQTGKVYDAQVISVKKGKVGTPGQLMGSLAGNSPLGTVEKNTPQGIFGTGKDLAPSDALPVGTPEQTKTGPATIRACVDNTVREYSVEILKIYPNATDRCRNMLVKITDPALLAATGGIVQGMSGSPIIQDGKLVGAVTHVLVNDPTMGYGIFIENMLNAAA